jgi:hypothetical protein
MSENPTPSKRAARRKADAVVDTLVKVNLQKFFGKGWESIAV